MKESILKNKSYDFALLIIELYKTLSKEKALSIYYDRYYQLVNQLPNIFQLSTNSLNDEKVVDKLLQFCGIKNGVLISPHLNKIEDDPYVVL